MGLIHLYSATSTSFDGNGTPLVTAREAVVKRDEGFQLTFSIPISQNELHKRVQKEMIVSAMTPDGVNYFRIWDIDKRTTDVKVTALQLLYSLDVKQVNPFGGKQYTGTTVLQAFVNSFKSPISPYTFSSSILTLMDFYTNEEDDTSTSHNALAILNKITDSWSGELMLNGFDVRMISKLGTKTDALLYEHKNIASFSDSSSMNGIVTRIYATATYTPERAEGATEDPEPVVLAATVDSPLINQYAVIYEATMEYNDARTVNELRTEILKQYSEFNVDKPERTIDVDTNIVDGTAINFGDELVLKYLVHDVDEVIRCVGYEYDPISENYIGVTLGTLEKTFLTKVAEGISSSVSRQFDKINRDIQGIQTAANGRNRIAYGPSPVPNAIEGDLWFYHPEGRPDEVELLVYQNGLWVPAPFLTDQDKAEFDQAMTEHYNNAIAEIERKDAEYKEIFDDYDETVATMDQEISDAATKAQSALEEAGISNDLAQTAKDLATTAESNASTAKADASAAVTNANQAKEDAQAAVINANQAKADASTAKTNAQTALDDAQTAITNAGTAATDASQAKEDAQTAITEAGQAVVSANTAKSNAQTALTDAQTALSTANNADTKSGLAEIAANTAKTNAQTALDNSSTAITNAADAITKAGQAETTANTAKTNAQTALDDAQLALTTAGSADTKAGQAIAKANAIPTTITDIIADKNLVNGTYVDTKVNDATGAWSQELVRVEGVIDGIEIGGRNLLKGSSEEKKSSREYLVYENIAHIFDEHGVGQYTFSFDIKLDVAGDIRVYCTDTTTDLIKYHFGQRIFSATTEYKRYHMTVDVEEVTSTATRTGLAFYGTYDTGRIPSVKNVKIEKGNKATDWTPAPEDLYSQEEFKIFNAQYTQDVTGITGRLTTVETDKLDGSTFQTFKQSEYQVTADKVASTITRVDTAEGKITTQGTAISQQATAIASKADKTVVDTLSGTVSNQGTLISQNATDISSKADSELVDDIKGTVDTHTTEISQNATDIASKASSTSVNALTGRVSTAETTISQHATAITSKASQTEVDTVKGTVSSHTTTLGQHATAISSKAESSLVNTIKDTVDTHTTDISQNATDIASKASSTSVNALTGRVSTAESNIGQNATAITQRVTTTTYNTGIASKENTVLKQSTAPAHVNGRLWLDTSVTPNILKRSTGSAWVKATPTTPGEVGAYSQSAGAGLAGRLTTAETTITQTATAIQSKADQTEVDTVKGTVSGHTTTLSQHATAIASKAESSLVNTIKGTVDTHTTEISQNATDIASKASSSSVNTLTGRVSTAESDISQNATAISQRVTTTTYNAGIASKENSVLKQSAAPSHLNGRLWLDTSVTPNILKRSTGTSWVKATPTTASEVGAYSSGQGNALAGRVTTAETNITQTATAITSKADQTEVDTVKGTVSGHTTTLSQHATAIASKAESSLVNTIKGTVDTHTTEISQNATAIASKASSSSVSTLTGRVSTAETTITQHGTSIASKASQTEVDTVKGTVASHTSTLSQHATQIGARLTSSQVNSLVDGKGFSTVNYVDNQITASASGIRADMSVVEGKIDNLQVGGRNLIKRRDFGNIVPSGVSGVAVLDEDYQNGLKATGGNNGRNNYIEFPDVLTGNGWYTVSFLARGTQGGTRGISVIIGGSPSITDGRISNTSNEYTYHTYSYEVENYNSETNNSIKIAELDYAYYRIDNIKLEKGSIATDWSPAPEDTMMENDFNIFKASYEATAQSLTSRLTAVDKVGGRLSTAETSISQNATAISSKANTSTVNTLTGRVSTAETKITQNATAITSKASQSEVNTVKGTVSGHTTTLSQHATAISSKAESSLVNTIKGTVDTHTTNISQNATAIASKASSSSVNTLTGRVSTAETTITQHATQISARLTSSQVNSLVDGKGFATQTWANNQITASANGIRTDLTKVEGKIDGLEIGGRNYALGTSKTLSNTQLNVRVRAEVVFNELKKLEGKDITISFEAKSTHVGNATVYILDLENYQQLGQHTHGVSVGSIGTSWKKYSVTVKVNNDISLTSVSEVTLAHNLSVSHTVEVRSLKVEKGNIATDWSPAPEDTVMETDFTVFKGEYEVTAQQLTSRLTAIDKTGGRLATAESNISQNATAINARLTSSQVNSLVNGKGFATSTYVDNQITATANSFGIELTKVEEKIPTHIGGVNILKNTRDARTTASSHDAILSYSLAEDIVPYEWYELSFNMVNTNNTDIVWLSLGDDSVSIHWIDQGFKPTTTRTRYSFVFQSNYQSRNSVRLMVNNRTFNIKSNTGTMTVDEVKLSRGKIPTDYSEAPSDYFTYTDTKVIAEAGRVEQLITNVKNSPTTTITGYNSLKNNVDSMVQAIGTNGGKIAQMVMTDSLFSTKVLEQVNIGGRNLLKNSNFADKLSGWGVNYPDYVSLQEGPRVNIIGAAGSGIYQNIPDSEENEVYTVSAKVRGSGAIRIGFNNNRGIIPITSFEWKRVSFTGVRGSSGAAIFYANTSTDNLGIMEPKVEKGNVMTEWSPNPDDKANQSEVTQLANSWALNIKSAGDIITQIDANPAGVRIKGKNIHLDGNTLINNAIISSAHIHELNANKIVGNTADFNKVRTGVLIANAVTSTHINANTAFFDKVFSTTSATDRLAARDAWIENANIKGINANKITAGTISASRISTSSLNNVEIGGRNYLLNTKRERTLTGYALFYTLSPDKTDLNYRDTVLSFEARHLSGSSPVRLHAYYRYSDARGGTGSTHVDVDSNTSTSWKRFYVRFTDDVAPDDISNYDLITIRKHDSVNEIRIRNVILSKGVKETEWSPAPDDIVNDLGASGRVEIHGGNIKADTLDVGAITGNKATFISTGFKSLNSQATINGHAIRIQNSSGEFVEMNNTPELRSDDAGGTAVVLGKGRVHFYDSRGHSKGYVGTDMHTAGSYDFGTFLSKGSGIYKFARMADATQTTYAYYTVKSGLTAPANVITNMVQNGYLPDGNPAQFVAKGNMLSQLNGWPAYPNWPKLTAGQQIRYKELTSQTTGDAYEDIWKFGPSSQGDWRIYFAKHATFEGGTTGTSDRRLKHDIEPTQIEALGHIESLAFKEFKWNRDNKYEPLGLIAQDSGIVRVADDDMEGIDIQRAIMLGLKGIQELQEIVKEQAEEIRQLKEINNQ